ncbi:MAG: NHL repeat-containing protein [Thermodesulfobacteriota bacterium]|nr:NHL repeat-containing protein [Thermodesulfobacteriota bacterium]
MKYLITFFIFPFWIVIINSSFADQIQGEFKEYFSCKGMDPTRISIDYEGNIFVSDAKGARIIVFGPDFKLMREIYGIKKPLGIAIGMNGNLYVGDDSMDGVHILNKKGNILASLALGKIAMPNDIDFDSYGNIYVVDSKNNNIKVINGSGNIINIIGGPGSGRGKFLFPTSVLVDRESREIIVGDQINGRVQFFDLEGTFKRSLGSFGNGRSKFSRLTGIARDKNNIIYIADTFQGTVQALDEKGKFLGFIGSYGDNKNSLNLPVDIAIFKDYLLVTSPGNSRIVVFKLMSVLNDAEHY